MLKLLSNIKEFSDYFSFHRLIITYRRWSVCWSPWHQTSSRHHCDHSLDLNPVDYKLCCVLQVSFKVVILLRVLYSNFVSCVDASQSETAWFTVEPKGVSRQRDDTTFVYCYRRWCWRQRWRDWCGVTRRCRVEQWPFHVTTRLSYSSRCHSTTLWLVVGPLTTTTLNSVVSTSHHHHSCCIHTFPVSDAD